MSSLAKAACKGDVSAVKRILEKNANINRCTRRGTALIESIIFNHEDVAEVLLGHPKINVNLKTHEGHTALHVAIRYGLRKTVDALLARKDTNVNIQNNVGNTPLLTAVRYKNSHAVGALVDHPDIQVNIQNKWKNTAVLWAMKKERENLVLLLLSNRETDIKIKGEDGKSVLEFARVSNREGLIDKLEQRMKRGRSLTPMPSSKYRESRSKADKAGLSLITAIQKNYNMHKIERLLASNEININAQNESGNTPLLS